METSKASSSDSLKTERSSTDECKTPDLLYDNEVYSFYVRKRQNYPSLTKLVGITNEILEWPTPASEDEIDNRFKRQLKLSNDPKLKQNEQRWKVKKELFKQLRPQPQHIPFRSSVKQVTVTSDNSYSVKRKIQVPKVLSDEEIFEKIPAFFEDNPFFIDLDEKFKTNWFTVRQPVFFLKKKADIEELELANFLFGTHRKNPAPVVVETKSYQIKIESDNDYLGPDSEDEETAFEKKPSETAEEKPPADEISENEGNPDSDQDAEASLFLDEKTKTEILKKASMYRQEFGLKSIKHYFFKWKNIVDKFNEKILQKIKRKEEKRSKKIVEKSLIERENVKALTRDQVSSKDLYYENNQKELRLTHILPGKLNKFIRNCNNIYCASLPEATHNS